MATKASWTQHAHCAYTETHPIIFISFIIVPRHTIDSEITSNRCKHIWLCNRSLDSTLFNYKFIVERPSDVVQYIPAPVSHCSIICGMIHIFSLELKVFSEFVLCTHCMYQRQYVIMKFSPISQKHSILMYQCSLKVLLHKTCLRIVAFTAGLIYCCVTFVLASKLTTLIIIIQLYFRPQWVHRKDNTNIQG